MKIFNTKKGLLSADTIAEVRRALDNGAIIGFPTETVYGVGCLVSQPQAIDAIYEIKNRATNKPMSLHISSPDIVSKYITHFPPFYEAFVQRFWPGPVTLIMGDAHGNTVGFRYPDCPIALQLIDSCGGEIFATSANVSGDISPQTASDIIEAFGERIDVVIDDGRCKYSCDSTIVLVEQNVPTIIREGAIGFEVQAFFDEWVRAERTNANERHIVFVCTGNTCRSPMGEGWLKWYIEKKKQSDHFFVESCGVYAYDGMPASEGAVKRMKKEGIDITSHRSQAMTRHILESADVIFCMSYAHKKAIMDMCPSAEERVIVLDVADPIGFGDMVYNGCFDAIEKGVMEHLDSVMQGI